MRRAGRRLAVRVGAAAASGIVAGVAGTRTQALLHGQPRLMRITVGVGAVWRVLLLLLRPAIAVERAARLLLVVAVRPVGAMVCILLVAGARERVLNVEAAHPAGKSRTPAVSAPSSARRPQAPSTLPADHPHDQRLLTWSARGAAAWSPKTETPGRRSRSACGPGC